MGLKRQGSTRVKQQQPFVEGSCADKFLNDVQTMDAHEDIDFTLCEIFEKRSVLSFLGGDIFENSSSSCPIPGS